MEKKIEKKWSQGGPTVGYLVIFFFNNIFLKKINLKLRINLKFYKKIRSINVTVSLLTFKI
jgi:hypothetical protein